MSYIEEALNRAVRPGRKKWLFRHFSLFGPSGVSSSMLAVFRGQSALFLAVFLALLTPPATAAGASGCFEAAAAWIEALPQPPDQRQQEILLSHSRSTCRFAHHWLEDTDKAATSSQRRRTCKDLVLIWTHKECIYFRDTIFFPAYEPCKHWSRLMFEKCMAGENRWFREKTEKDGGGDSTYSDSSR